MFLQYNRLYDERLSIYTQMSNIREELETVKGEVTAEQAALSTEVLRSQAKQESLGAAIKSFRTENELLSGQATHLQRQVAESEEVVDAIKSQLCDFRQMVGMVGPQPSALRPRAFHQRLNLAATNPPLHSSPRTAPGSGPQEQEQGGAKQRWWLTRPGLDICGQWRLPQACEQLTPSQQL
jgi:hypothetical protein